MFISLGIKVFTGFFTAHKLSILVAHSDQSSCDQITQVLKGRQFGLLPFFVWMDDKLDGALIGHCLGVAYDWIIRQLVNFYLTPALWLDN